MITRRELLLSSAAVTVGVSVGHTVTHATPVATHRARLASSPPRLLNFEVAERSIALPCFNGKQLPLWTFSDADPMPIVRVPLGTPLDVKVKNALTREGENVTIHWHGLNIPNREDGVPYLTQQPIEIGQTGTYDFLPPETGTYFFHTHCNSVEHFGRGLVGALIVEGDEIDGSDADHVLIMKDWRLGPDGSFLPFTSDASAAKAGTTGTVRAINGTTRPVFDVPASANVRIRLLNVDPARIADIGITNADAAIIAIDGNACAPIPLDSWRTGPATRLDIVMRSPKEGNTVELVDYFAPEPVVLAVFNAVGPPRRKSTFKPPALKAMAHPKADIGSAERIELAISATPTGAAVAAAPTLPGFEDVEIGKLCLSSRTFWALNKKSWASENHTSAGPPLASLKRGATYIFELKNATPNAHPIHIHGHTFEVLSSNLRKLPKFRADTILVLPKERIEVALVADNPGRWMVHCHILEHQETGMMGYITVS